MKNELLCGDCEAVLIVDQSSDGPRLPCPECGSVRHVYHKDVRQVLTPYHQIRLKDKRPGCKKPIEEQIVGAEYSQSTGRFSNKVRVIDRLNNWYFERITDPKTGAVLHECDEPLSHHFGRGSAGLQDHGFPHEHIAVAAYFIWEKKGRRDGSDKAHWNMAIEDLRRATSGVPTQYS